MERADFQLFVEQSKRPGEKLRVNARAAHSQYATHEREGKKIEINILINIWNKGMKAGLPMKTSIKCLLGRRALSPIRPLVPEMNRKWQQEEEENPDREGGGH